MEHMHLCGAVVQVDGSQMAVIEDQSQAVSANAGAACNGNACGDIDMQWDEDTRSYHFFNDGNQKVRLRVQSATIPFCGGWKTRNMRPGDEWDSGLYGVCKYEANYR
ncbi:MAG: hypothetical protein AAGB51_13945 [Planctomycetota bacterium]